MLDDGGEFRVLIRRWEINSFMVGGNDTTKAVSKHMAGKVVL
jgi:hypothetical protein